MKDWMLLNECASSRRTIREACDAIRAAYASTRQARRHSQRLRGTAIRLSLQLSRDRWDEFEALAAEIDVTGNGNVARQPSGAIP